MTTSDAAPNAASNGIAQNDLLRQVMDSIATDWIGDCQIGSDGRMALTTLDAGPDADWWAVDYELALLGWRRVDGRPGCPPQGYGWPRSAEYIGVR